MLTKNQLTTIILLAACFWGGLLLAQGVSVSADWMKPLSAVVGALMVVLSAFNLWLWKWPVFRGWLVKRPVIAGTWKASLRSTWVDPATGSTVAPIAGFMVIRQTYSELSMRLLTEESSSMLLGAEMTRAPDGAHAVSGVYRNEPKMAVRAKSQIHHGAILLQIVGSPPTALRGHYWTDRSSAGDMELTTRTNKVFDDYVSASSAG
jgi:predicted pore-forming effector associated with SMODS systems